MVVIVGGLALALGIFGTLCQQHYSAIASRQAQIKALRSGALRHGIRAMGIAVILLVVLIIVHLERFPHDSRSPGLRL
jgi:hypothetical protein